MQDGIAGERSLQYTDPGSFNSSAGTAHNVAIPTGINAAGAATGTRASGAVRDSRHGLSGHPDHRRRRADHHFPALIVDWGTQADGTFFSSGPPQHIALLSDLADDTDEFDQHVIAHEFGHYIENNFSRADNIGGHTAWATSSIRASRSAKVSVTRSRPSCSTTRSRATAPRQRRISVPAGFNIETNPPTSPVGAPSDNYGCWCSESSVCSILWDLYDSAADANDSWRSVSRRSGRC